MPPQPPPPRPECKNASGDAPIVQIQTTTSFPLGRPSSDTTYLRIHRAEPSSIEACRRLSTEVAWDAFEPRGTYYRYVRPLVNLCLGLVAAPFVIGIGSLVATANVVQYRGVRRAFFRQPRVGRRGRIFHIFKFRTMEEVEGTQMTSWSSGDEGLRVTGLGRFLRNTHLDELPQFLNILRGEMTFIGPRPEMIEVEEWARAQAPGFETRLVLKPGITGLAQITQGYTGRDRIAYLRKLALNEKYRVGTSLRMDISIIAGTLLWMVRGRGWSGTFEKERPDRIARRAVQGAASHDRAA